jgi:hypothetical protein
MLRFAIERGRHTGLRFVMSLRSSGLRCNEFVSALHPREKPYPEYAPMCFV